MQIGYKLKRLLRIRKMSQQELAERSGVSLAMVKALANDKRPNTTVQTLTRLSEALGVPITYFLKEEISDPRQFMGHVPEDLQSFILDPANIGYLHLAYLAAKKKLSPEALEKIITCCSEIFDLNLQGLQ